MESRIAWVLLGAQPGASYEDARHAYLVRAQLLHPDRHRGAPADVRLAAENAMQTLNEAWTTVRSEIDKPHRPRDDRMNETSGFPPSAPPKTSAEADTSAASHRRDDSEDVPSASDTAEDCLDWFFGALTETMRRHTATAARSRKPTMPTSATALSLLSNPTRGLLDSCLLWSAARIRGPSARVVDGRRLSGGAGGGHAPRFIAKSPFTHLVAANRITGGSGRYRRTVSPPGAQLSGRRRPGTSPRCRWRGGRVIPGPGRSAWLYADQRGWPPPGRREERPRRQVRR